ncbi:MAG: HAD hydrolase family protein [Euryarchaeota archaeon]|nr:HAD hydrolase family protein [Euryarchaeota archaeon]MBU4138974.1 HAD hydrolase family protein [Euryarchaeota archaeon]
MEFKAIVVDIDGTITYSDRSIDCRAVEALRSVKVPVVIATGNVLCFARAASKLVGTGGLIVAENGGVVECGTVESDTSHMKMCEEAFDHLNRHFPLELLKASGFGVAVGNAHPDVKKAANMVTKGEHGAGVAEAIQYISGKTAI